MHDPSVGLGTGQFQHTPERTPIRGRIPGEVGIWVFIFGDMLAFALLFIVFTNARMDEPAVFEASRRTLHLAFGAVNTLLLLVGSLLVVRGIRALRTRSGRGPLLFGLCWLCGVSFMVNKFIEYRMIAGNGHQIGENLFYAYYFVLTGVHLLHLLVAVVGMAYVWRLSCREVRTPVHMRNIESFGAYWHLVDLLWVILFPLIYLMRV